LNLILTGDLTAKSPVRNISFAMAVVSKNDRLVLSGGMLHDKCNRSGHNPQMDIKESMHVVIDALL